MQAIAEPAPLAAKPLWQRTRAMFARAVAAIGAPASIAAMTLLPRQLRRKIAGWVALLESIVRKLVFAEAAALRANARAAAQQMPRLEVIALAPAGWTAGAQPHIGPSRATQKTAPQCISPEAPRALDLTQPHTWPARFAPAPPRDPRACPESRAPRIRALWGPMPPPPTPPPARRAPKRTPLALRLAFRLEALRRAIEDPMPHARRLARVFARLSQRYPEAASRFAMAPARPYFADRDDPRLIIEVLARAMGLAPVWADTS